jgi:hypothetical protein
MNERRKPESKHLNAEQIVTSALKGATATEVVVGPVLFHPDGSLRRYFIIATCGSEGFRCEQIIVTRPEDKTAVLSELAKRQPPLVIHDMNDELAMARLCEELWPGENIKRLRVALEAERRV